jgi:hypothetical protein
MEKKRFKKLFPFLAEEMESGKSKTYDFAVNKPKTKRKWEGYEPNVIDFLRRCDTHLEANEILDYLEARGDLQTEEAENLRKKLAKEGIRSFGDKKTTDFYERGN